MDLLPFLPDAECRVMLVIARKTHGYHKACDVISLSQLIEATGMVRQGAINGINAAIKRGILKRTPSGHNNGYCYEIDQAQVVHEIDRLKQSTKQTSPRNRLQVVHEIDHQVVHEIDPQKKDIKKKKERGGSPPASLDFMHEGVTIWKRLTGRKHITPANAAYIAGKITDIPLWERVVTAWLQAGYNPDNVKDMCDWYDHPEKMEQRNGRLNGHRPPSRQDAEQLAAHQRNPHPFGSADYWARERELNSAEQQRKAAARKRLEQEAESRDL